MYVSNIHISGQDSYSFIQWRHLRGRAKHDCLMLLAVRRRISRCILSFQARARSVALSRHSFPVIHRRQIPFLFAPHTFSHPSSSLLLASIRALSLRKRRLNKFLGTTAIGFVNILLVCLSFLFLCPAYKYFLSANSNISTLSTIPRFFSPHSSPGLFNSRHSLIPLPSADR